MSARRIALYFAWSRPEETGAPLDTIENRFPALFESRRMLYPKFEELSDPTRFEQGIGGFLDHIMRQNFADFTKRAAATTGQPVLEVERVGSDGQLLSLQQVVPDEIDTLIVISFDSLRTQQQASEEEIAFARRFLSHPDHLLFLGPHHAIGEESAGSHEERVARQLGDFLHHGDKTIPPQQGFGGFARSLLAGLGVPVENRFGLRPAAEPDGTPAPIMAETALDRLHLLAGVQTFNLHAHLPQLERLGPSMEKLDVLARQKISLTAPPHPFTAEGRATFDALLQSRENIFAGTLLVGDATLWSSTAGGVESLSVFWKNLITRPQRQQRP